MLTFAEVHAAALTAVRIKGADYIYTEEFPECRYGSADDDPQGGAAKCIVGHVARIANFELAREGVCYGRTTDHIISPDDVCFKGRVFLGIAQSCQDVGVPWGQAVTIAADYVAKYDDDGVLSDQLVWASWNENSQTVEAV